VFDGSEIVLDRISHRLDDNALMRCLPQQRFIPPVRQKANFEQHAWDCPGAEYVMLRMTRRCLDHPYVVVKLIDHAVLQ